GGAPGPMCAADGFADAGAQWRLPFELTDGNQGPGGPSHLVMDLNGDGLIDLLVLDDAVLPEADALVGRAYWKLYPGSGAGFAEAGSDWRLPFPIENGVSRLGSVIGITDFTGDGLPDLMVYRDDILPENDPLVGRAYWQIYENTGSGFAQAPAQWSLPFPLEDQSGPGGAYHALADLNADGLLDLVVTKDDILPEGDPLVGRAYWKIYANTGRGFAPGGSQWSLPFPLEDRSNLGSDSHTLLDLDGNGALDLVVYDADILPENDPLVSRAYWLVYANTGAGFAQGSSTWSLPFSVEDGRGRIAATEFGLLDLDADGGVDLVVYDDDVLTESDPLIGRAYWKVHANTGAGFAMGGADWRLPYPLVDGARGPGTRHHGVWAGPDLCPALFFYSDDELPESDPLIGRAYWRYHP
ncbi:MAG: VCBS repeat-containing protein, partial [Myxococcales bacterium]|nr:VCBS repeat-containing protein [Myxococcales bacterium]